ncbi:T9SS type A sorting domain-containing protein [uncultured Draconibacterium sp.]|uniref:T9SS type A sorting domain-containing protein n=1 Tax=uncultured Draconibacterium sp. TaxID=1573823 RepID=UPI002AA7E687|nr:T9SS type A sorting domain-containing protein [uncultured Draconibacterium sp.]
MDNNNQRVNLQTFYKPCLIVVFICSLLFAAHAQESTLPAFPGAGGFGKYVTGGRGGQVIYVTTLEDNTQEGSLRYAISRNYPRIVIFKVAGTIQLKASLKISNNDITIAGQTAPGDGITLRDYPVKIEADNVIIRYMRFRMGDETEQEDDALGGRYQKNIIIDHCSMSWSTDECASFYNNENFTLQWSLLSESLRISVHEKGTHGYGGIWGGEKASFHHNLLAHHDSRNPRFCGSRYSNRAEYELVDFRNNVIYNWGANSVYAAEGGRYNMVNNYYKSGPATSSSKTARIIQPWADNGGNDQPAGIYGTFFIDGNYMTASASVSENNWDGVDMSSSFDTYAPGVTKSDLVSDTEYDAGEVVTHSAEEAYLKVLDFVGASLAYDSVDNRIIHETATGTVTYPEGGNGSTNGLIDSQGAVGGWPLLTSNTAPDDSDEDGMPDAWETANALNPNDPSDAQLTTVDGLYPNVEVYLNSLVAEITEQQDEDGVHTSINDVARNEDAISMYYNGIGQTLMINHYTGVRSVEVYNITGKLIAKHLCNSSAVQLPVSGNKKGIYLVRVMDINDKTFTRKIPVF